MIGEVAAFAIDDLVKELRCIAARDMCEYHHDGIPCGYDHGNPYDLCSLAADEIEMLRGRAERAENRIRAAMEHIQNLIAASEGDIHGN